MTEISQDPPSETSSSARKALYVVLATTIGCYAYGEYQHEFLGNTLQKAKALWTEVTTQKHHNEMPLKPACEDAEACKPH